MSLSQTIAHTTRTGLRRRGVRDVFQAAARIVQAVGIHASHFYRVFNFSNAFCADRQVGIWMWKKKGSVTCRAFTLVCTVLRSAVHPTDRCAMVTQKRKPNKNKKHLAYSLASIVSGRGEVELALSANVTQETVSG